MLVVPLLVYGFVISSWGWGQLLHLILNKKEIRETPLCVLAGFLHMVLIPYVLWVLHVPFPFSLGLTATVGLASALYFQYFRIWPWDYHLAIFILGCAALIIDYIPVMDDEFNLWASAPIRMFLEGTLLPKEASCWDTYTPLSHLWGMYFQFLIVFKSFAGDTGIYISRSTIWLTLIYYMKNSVSKRWDAQIVMVFAAYALTTLYRGRGYHSLVIESITYPIITYAFLMAKQFIETKNPTPYQEYTLGLSVLGGYMFKKSLIPLFVSWGYWAWGKVTLRSVLIFFIASLVVIVSWYLACMSHNELWQYKFQNGWWYNDRAMLVYKALYQRVLEFWPNWVLLVGGLFLLQDNKRFKIGVIVCISIYVIGLVVLYLQSFNVEEASRLASFKRYMTVLIVPTVLIAVYSALQRLKDKTPKDAITTFVLLALVLSPLLSYSRGDLTPIRQIRDDFFQSPQNETTIYHDKAHRYSQQLDYYARIFRLWGKTLKHQEIRQ